MVCIGQELERLSCCVLVSASSQYQHQHARTNMHLLLWPHTMRPQALYPHMLSAPPHLCPSSTTMPCHLITNQPQATIM